MAEPCPLCKSAQVRVEYDLTGYQIAICGQCGFEYHDGFKGGGGDAEMFSEDYYRRVQRDAFAAQFDDYTKDPSAAVFAYWLGKMEAQVATGRVLDVGSALGTFLKIAETRGWSPQGVENSRFAAEFTHEKRGIPVFNGDLEQFPGEDAAFYKGLRDRLRDSRESRESEPARKPQTSR